jgi:hypothetical protein
MRIPVALLVLVSAILLMAYAGFSQVAAIPVVLGAGIVLVANWNSKRLAGLAGFFIAVVGVTLITKITDMTVVDQLLTAGFLLVLPACLLLWCAISVGGSKDEPMTHEPMPYIGAVAFAFTVLATVPIAWNLFPSMNLPGDVGVHNSIMLISFTAAIWSLAILGRTKN